MEVAYFDRPTEMAKLGIGMGSNSSKSADCGGPILDGVLDSVHEHVVEAS